MSAYAEAEAKARAAYNEAVVAAGNAYYDDSPGSNAAYDAAVSRACDDYDEAMAKAGAAS